MPLICCRTCGRRSRVRRESIGSVVTCQQCGAKTHAQVSLFHSAHPAGLWVGRIAFACAAVGAAWVGWCVWQSGAEGSVADEVLTVTYAACIALFTGVGMTWRHHAAMRLRQW